MRRFLAGLLLTPVACAAPVRNDASSTDYYGLEPGLIRVYRSRLPFCGRPHDHYMEKVVEKTIPFEGGRAVLIEGRLSTSVSLHGMNPFFSEVFVETAEGFGYYKIQEAVERAEPARVKIELPKPVVPGTRREFKEGEIVVEAVEDVVVPAGKFVGCIRLRTRFHGGGANVFWFAPGAGMVRGYSEKKGEDGRSAMEFELVQVSRR